MTISYNENEIPQKVSLNIQTGESDRLIFVDEPTDENLNTEYKTNSLKVKFNFGCHENWEAYESGGVSSEKQNSLSCKDNDIKCYFIIENTCDNANIFNISIL